MSFIFVDLMGIHDIISPNNSNTKSRTVSLSVIFVHFVDQSLFAGHQENMTRDHIPILLSYKRSERISSQMASTIPHVRVWCHFIPLEQTVVLTTRGYTRETFVYYLMKVAIKTTLKFESHVIFFTDIRTLRKRK